MRKLGSSEQNGREVEESIFTCMDVVEGRRPTDREANKRHRGAWGSHNCKIDR